MDEQVMDAGVVHDPEESRGESVDSVRRVRQPLASLLADAGVASEEQLRLAVAEGMGTGERLGELVVKRGWIDETGLARILARQWEMAFVEDGVAVADTDASALLSVADAESLAACVLGLVEGAPLVAVAEPSEERFTAVQGALGRECAFVIVAQSTLRRLLTELASAQGEAEALAEDAEAARAADDDEFGRLMAELERAATNLLGVREQLERLLDGQGRNERELTDAREHIDRLTADLTIEKARVQELESKLAHDRELLATVKSKLADASRALGDGKPT